MNIFEKIYSATLGPILHFLCEVTGINEEFCRVKHLSHHKRYQLQYNGLSLVHCEKCKRSFERP